MSFAELFGLLLLGALAWFWLDSLKASEAALAGAQRACRAEDLQFLDGSVTIESVWLMRDESGSPQKAEEILVVGLHGFCMQARIFDCLWRSRCFRYPLNTATRHCLAAFSPQNQMFLPQTQPCRLLFLRQVEFGKRLLIEDYASGYFKLLGESLHSRHAGNCRYAGER